MIETLKKGIANDIVKAAKYLSGYSEMNEATDVFDDDFESYIKAWQAEREMTANGVIDSETLSAIVNEVPTCSTSKHKKSAYTCAVQILVGGLDVDGSYGPKTKAAVAAFQSANGLKADGICGPKTWAALIGVSGAASSSGSGSGATPKETIATSGKVVNKCVHYLQWDSRWKNIKYSTHTSEQTIGNSGCGPTSMAMILATFIDPKITPVEICALSVKQGYRTYDSGTKWGLFEYVYKHYQGFSQYVPTQSIPTLKSALAQGALAVCSMNSGDNNFWTKGGHFIVAIGYDDSGYIYANDPNKSSAPRKQKQDKFKTCLKQAFIFWPAAKETTKTEPAETQQEPAQPTETAPQTVAATGTSIIDISKWQGTIDFTALRKKVAFVIARAGVGSDADSMFDSYANDMKKNGIPFGVYCYSYAGTEAKAKEEAQKLVSRAKKYNPLFYVMDAEEEKITNAAIKAFANELRAQGAERIGCYVAHNRYKAYDYDSLRSLFNFTWIPRYGSNDGTVSGSTKPSYICDLWQFTSTGKIDGISGKVDMNIITGQGKTLEWFLNGTATTDTATETVTTPTGEMVKIQNGNVNVRTEPNTSGKILGVAYKGDELVYGGKTADNGWLSVIYNGKDGWVSNKYGRLV